MKKLSVIIVGRDDNYGDDRSEGIYNLGFTPKTFIQRIKYSLETNIPLLEKYFGNDFEYIIVDWSPIENKILKENLEIKSILENKNVKNIIVNPRVVSSMGLNPKSFYEYFGKNVGIRNSQGDFILITNSDGYFDEPMVSEIFNIVNSGNTEYYYRPKTRKDVDCEFNITGEGDCFSKESIFGEIGTPASGDFTMSHRDNIITIGEGYNECMSTSNSENHRQTALDGALLINMYLRGIKPYCLENSIYSFDHNKIERFNFFEILSEYKNIENWGLNDKEYTELENTIIYK